jgi:hypothetical protein
MFADNGISPNVSVSIERSLLPFAGKGVCSPFFMIQNFHLFAKPLINVWQEGGNTVQLFR